MSYGVLEYNNLGLVKCEICGEYFNKVVSHTRQKHGMLAREYKKTFGFDNKRGIMSQKSRNLARERNAENYKKVVEGNLIKDGKTTRFSPGSTGRTKDMVREQTRLRLTEHITKIAKSQRDERDLERRTT